MKNYLSFLLLSLLVLSCSKPEKKAGKINLQLVVYNDPNGDLYNSFLMEITDLYFIGNRFLEKLPYPNDSLGVPKFYYIHKNRFAPANSLEEIKSQSTLSFQDVTEKIHGSQFVIPDIPGYDKRASLPDTNFNGYSYKRVRIATDSVYSVFYIHQTDTVLPFSINPAIEKEYSGILNRVDSYNRVEDKFYSLRMTVTDTIPQSIFDVLNSVK
ncbi:MAG TPA: hypothetical protein VKZ57_02745 [Sphingobacterium sp.]|nr:hypothetical protein [Sphingobacterium sp.]